MAASSAPRHKRSGEAMKDVIQHLVQCFMIMGKPLHIKTDNGPAYVSKAFEKFLSQWSISHTTGIPYNPQGQAIIERTHQTLKLQIERLQNANNYLSPHHVLNHSLFVLNHLNMDSKDESPAFKHWAMESNKTPLPLVLWKDLLTGSWKGPDPLITSGRGYACIFPQDEEAPLWIPDRLIRPAPQKIERRQRESEKSKADTGNESFDIEATEASDLDSDQAPDPGS
ncbi:hypothetical protein STEG23_003697 [Scotinomys teguina]